MLHELLTEMVNLLDEQDRLIANAFGYNPEQLEAKLNTSDWRLDEINIELNKKLKSLPTRRQYDNLLFTIGQWADC